jgi:hypothetical protein
LELERHGHGVHEVGGRVHLISKDDEPTRCLGHVLTEAPGNTQNLTLSLIHRFNDHTSRLIYELLVLSAAIILLSTVDVVCMPSNQHSCPFFLRQVTTS